MSNRPDRGRTDTASRLVKASPHDIFEAFVNPVSLAAWLPPQGMTGHVARFEPRTGGAYRITLFYDEPAHATRGKTSDHADVVSGRFLELTPGRRIVQVAEFDSPDDAFSGEMTITWTLDAAPGGTKVTIECENVPAGIGREDHETGLRSTLDNLAAFFE